MNKEIVDSIENIKCKVLENGIGLNDYFQLKKRMSKKIDFLIESKLELIKCLYVRNVITEEQYKKNNKILESNRSQYKKLLNFFGE